MTSDFDPNDPRDRELWQLLGRARTVEPSPFFVRKVLRAIEQADEPRPAWWRMLLRIVAPTAVCAGLAVAALVDIGRTSPAATAGAELEFETIENLDLLVSNYESSLWLDSSSR
jgi:hypothetical protein